MTIEYFGCQGASRPSWIPCWVRTVRTSRLSGSSRRSDATGASQIARTWQAEEQQCCVHPSRYRSRTTPATSERTAAGSAPSGGPGGRRLRGTHHGRQSTAVPMQSCRCRSNRPLPALPPSFPDEPSVAVANVRCPGPRHRTSRCRRPSRSVPIAQSNRVSYEQQQPDHARRWSTSIG